MKISKLDHVNVRTSQLELMIDWYNRILGLRSGARPDFPFHGAWLYAGDSPVVHLVEVDGNPGAGSEADLKLEHFAFSATNAASFEEKLNRLNEPFRRSELTSRVLSNPLWQYNVWDPDGNHIHVDFSADD